MHPDHAFDYTPVDLLSAYRPPLIPPSPSDTTYEYNLDRQLSRVTRPDGLLIDFLYDPAGRLGSQLLPGNASITYTYDPETGNPFTITAVDGGTLTFTYPSCSHSTLSTLTIPRSITHTRLAFP